MAENEKLDGASPELTEAAKARIRAEEEYRAQVRAEVSERSDATVKTPPKPAPTKPKTAEEIRAAQQAKLAEAARVKNEKLEAERLKQAEERANPNAPKRNPFLMSSEDRLIYDQVQRENWSPEKKAAEQRKLKLTLAIFIPVILICAAIILPPMLQARQQDRATAAARAAQAKTLAGQSPYYIREVCLDSVRGKLKAPATARFTDSAVPALTGAEWAWTSYVDAQNSFGATIRTSFTCRVFGQMPEDAQVLTVLGE